MLQQTHVKFKRFFRRWSCFIMAIIYLFKKQGEYETTEEIMELYYLLVEKGFILHSGNPPKEPWYRCWIHDKESCIEYISGERWKYIKQNPSDPIPEDALVIGEYLTQYDTIHFAVPEQSRVRGYNPDKSLELRKLVSCRVFIKERERFSGR